MNKTKKFIVTLGLATVLTVGACITASAAQFSKWDCYTSGSYHYGCYCAISYDSVWKTATLAGNYQETRSGGYNRLFNKTLSNVSEPNTPYYSSWLTTIWNGTCSGPTYDSPYSEATSASRRY